MSATDLIYNNFNSNRATVEKWLSYPRQLQMEYGINPVLAGGAMRDLILGGEVTNLDIFISGSKARMHGVDLNSFIKEIAEREGWTRNDPSVNSSLWTEELHSVWDFTSEFVDKPYNIIILPEDNSSQQVINSFDFGINMIAVNNYSIITVSKHFVDDVDKQQVTVINESSRARRDARYALLLQKYPAIPLISSEGLELDKPHAGLILPPGVG